MPKSKRDIGQEILDGVREIKANKDALKSTHVVAVDRDAQNPKAAPTEASGDGEPTKP